MTDSHPDDFHKAVRALQGYADYYTTSSDGGGTDVDVLWEIAGELVTALRSALEQVAELDPARRPEIAATLQASDGWVVKRAQEYPGALVHILSVYLGRDRIGRLPREALTILLEHEDQHVRVEAITALGEGRRAAAEGRSR